MESLLNYLGPIFMVCALKPRFSEIFQIYQKTT